MEETGVDLGPLARSPDFVAAFDCRDARLAPIGAISDQTGAVTQRAEAVHDAWRMARRVPGVRTAVWRGAGRTNLASDHGPVLVEGTAKLNLGVARVALRDLATISDAGGTAVDPPRFDDPVRHAIWSLLIRAQRAEIPRHLRLRADAGEATLHVHRGAIRFLQGARGAADLIAFVQQAGGQVEYSLDAPQDPPAGDPAWASDFLNGEPGGAWRFDADGWPLSCPSSAGFDTLANAIGLVRACGPIWGHGVEGDCLLLDAAGGRLAHIWMATDGMAGLGAGTFPTEPPH